MVAHALVGLQQVCLQEVGAPVTHQVLGQLQVIVGKVIGGQQIRIG